MAFSHLLRAALLRRRRVAKWAPSVLLWAAALACLAGAALGDWLVTRDGHRIETEGPWRVEGARVLFHSLGGTLHSIELSEIDLEASRRLTETLRGQPRLVYPQPVIRRTGEPRAERSRRVERWRRLQRDEVAIAAPSAPDVYVPVREPDGDRFEASIRLGATSHDNFFQAADDEPPTEMATGEAAALLSWRLAPGSRHRVFLEAARTELEELPATDALRLGLRLGGRRNTFHLSSRLQRGFKVQDLDDEEPEEVERRTFFGDYQLRAGRDWRLELAGELQQERRTTPSRDADSVELAAALRYRGLDLFSPEVGILWAENDGARDSRDYEQRGLFVKLRFFPAHRLAFELRGRQREREYSVLDPEASNFGRRDTRRDWSLGAHVLLLEDVVLSLRYELVDNESSRDRRSFSGHRLGLGLRFTVGGSRGGADPDDPSPPPRLPVTKPPVAPVAPRHGEAAVTVPAEPLPDAASPAPPPAPEPEVASPVSRSESAAPAVRPPEARGPSFAGVRVAARHGRLTAIEIRGAGLEIHADFMLHSPDRYVIDLWGVVIPRSLTVPVGSSLVKRVRVGQFQEPPPGVGRVVFDLERPLTPLVEKVPGGLRVTFEGR